MRGAWGLAALWLASQACLLAQAADTQKLAALLIPARGQVALTKEQADKIRTEFLAWTDDRIQKGFTIDQLNEQLVTDGLLIPEALYKTDDVYQPFAGYLEKITSEPIPSAGELLRITLHVGMTCSFDQTAVIYRRSALTRVGWINYPETEGSLAWGVNSITVGSPNPNGERIVAAGLMHRWCTSAWGSIELRIWRLREREMRPLFIRDLGARRDEDIAEVIDGDTVAFGYNRGVRDTEILIRPGIEKYKLEEDRVTRVAPVAVNIVGFIDEWLELDDTEAARWSGPEAIKNRGSAVSWAKDFVKFEGGSRCAGSPRLWQVSVKLADKEDRRIFLVNEDGAEHLQMVGFRSEPARECPRIDVADLMKELSQ